MSNPQVQEKDYTPEYSFLSWTEHVTYFYYADTSGKKCNTNASSLPKMCLI